MRKFRIFNSDDVTVFCEERDDVQLPKCYTVDGAPKNECKFCDHGVVCSICQNCLLSNEVITNVMGSSDLAGAIIGFIEGDAKAIRKYVKNIEISAFTPEKKREMEVSKIDEIILTNGMRYAPATAFAMLGLEDSDNIEVINEVILLLEQHKNYLKGRYNE